VPPPILKRKKPKKPKEPVSFSLSPDLVSRLKRVTDDYGYGSRSELVEELLSYALDEHEAFARSHPDNGDA
jgi:metal-responsive CopG/Arc/MetJ family transcriptional regulator